MKTKGNSLVIVILVLSLAIAAIFYLQRLGTLTFNLPKITSSVRSSVTFGANEDTLSLNSVPKDVNGAIEKAKTTGIPNQGIRVDGPQYTIPVLMYHYVEYITDDKDTIRASLDTTPATFESQLKTLQLAGYTFLKASEVANILDGMAPLPQKPIVLTFDDGHRDFYTGALPLLKKYNVKATAFIITGFLNGSDFLTEAELKDIAKNDLIEIGDHTVHHLALAGLPQPTVKREVEQSKLDLEAMIGRPVTSFAYPYGSFDLSAIQSLKLAGFRVGFSTIPGNKISNADRFFINRIRPGGATGESLINLIQKQYNK